jgi:hypothetical protein
MKLSKLERMLEYALVLLPIFAQAIALLRAKPPTAK